MKYIIYKITNNLNGRYYIGKHATHDVDDGYMGSGKLIKAAIRRYGVENFTKQILFTFDTEEEANAKEAALVTQSICESDESYNLVVGGRGGFSYINSSGIPKFAGRKHSDETKALISEKSKGNTHNRGRRLSDDHRQKLSESVKASVATRSAMKPRGPMSEEEKTKLSSLMREGIANGTIRTSAGIQRPSARGRALPDETKQRIAESSAAAWASGKRSRPDRDWAGIQKDLDAGVSRAEVYNKFGVTKNTIDHGIKTGKLISSRPRK